MTVGGDDCLVDVVDMLFQIFDLCTIFVRQTVTCCIRDVDDRGTRFDDCLNDTRQILVVRASGILRVELDILNILLRVCHGTDGTLEDVLAVAVALVLYMIVARSQPRVDALVLGILQCLGRTVDILLHGTCQCADGRPCNRFADFHYRIEVTGGRDGKAGLNDIDT